MKRWNGKIILLVLLLAVCAGCLPFGQGKLYQYSTINALMVGVYEGSLSVREAKMRGDFGLGTFNHLDGEMVLLDGMMYQVPFDGKVKIMEDGQCIPFTAVSFFDADQEIPIAAGLSYVEFQKAIVESFPSKNVIYAIRLDGVFTTMHTRSVPRQDPPYRPLSEVVKEQSEFTFENVQGTLVGYWLPAYVEGINVPGYHLHFLTADRTAGGHVLDFTTSAGTVKVDALYSVDMELPNDQAFLNADLMGDTSDDLEDVEKPK